MAGRTIELTRTIRGTEVTIYASRFDGDDSVGIPLGPEDVWAKDLDGNDFELTDDEVEQFGIEATKAYYEDDYE